MHVVTVSPTISTAIYASGDAVGGLLTFANAVRKTSFTGTIVAATLIDAGAQSAALVLQLFDRTFTPTADQAAYAPSDADIVNAIANIPFATADYVGGSANKVAHVRNLGIPLVCLASDLFGQLFLTAGTPTFPGDDNLTVKLFID